MSRASWRGFFLDTIFLKKEKKIKKVWSRRSTIPSFLIGKTLQIYNGKVFKKVKITREKVGYKFGEFSTTRIFVKKKKKVRKK